MLSICCSLARASAAESSVIEGAKKEGGLIFYTTMDIQNSKPLLDAFSKKYPFIRADLVRLGGTAMVSRILTEAQAGASKFDVAVGISPSLTPMRERNLIAPYISPEFANLYDDLYDAKGYLVDGLSQYAGARLQHQSDLAQRLAENLRRPAQTAIQAKIYHRYRKP